VDLQSDGQNCGTCGHSCLGGACNGGKCQAAQIYNGSDILPATFALDSAYLYFKHDKGNNVTVVARMPKGGGQIIDLTSVDEGAERVAVFAGKLYWAQGDTVQGCTAPSCSSPFTIMNQPQAALVTTNSDGTGLFWLRRGANFTADVMSNPTSPSAQGTIDNNPIFGGLCAVGTSAYVSADNTISRASGAGPATPVGDNGALLAANSRAVYRDGVLGGGTTPAVMQYAVSAIGSSQTATEVGHYNGATNLLAIAADETNTYWLVVAQGATRLVRCSVSGCGGSPTEIGSVPGSPSQAWLVLDVDAYYWATSDGVFRLAK
jgi:hypothetical protein